MIACHATFMALSGELASPMAQINIRKTVLNDGTVNWTVHIVGTQDLDPLSSNPHNFASAIAAANGQDTDVARAVREAMRQAGVGPDDPVMLAGHSLGGLTAANLAADPDFRSKYNVVSVVSSGASIGDRVIPPPTTVLEQANPYDPIVAGTRRDGGRGEVRGKSNHFYVPANPVDLPGLNLAQRALLAVALGGALTHPAGAFSNFNQFHHLEKYLLFAQGWGEWFGSKEDVARWKQLNEGFLCDADIASSELITYDSELL